MKKLKISGLANEPYCILGIITTENDLKLAWIINKILNINLSLVECEELKAKLGNTTCVLFQHYSNNQTVSLLSNKPFPFRPFEELKKYDYVLGFVGEETFQAELVKDLLKSSASIQAVFQVNKSEIKRKEILEYL